MKRRRILLYMMIICAFLFARAGAQVNATGIAERQVTAIELPQNLNFYLDPENKNGQGQIYSAKYIIRNAGKDAVNFSIDMALSLLDNQSSIVFCPEEWDTEPLDRSIYMYVVLKREQDKNVYVLTDLNMACAENVILAPAGQDGDTIYISFGGRLSQSEEWKSGELAVNALYAMSVRKIGYQARVEGEHIKLENAEEELTGGKRAELYLAAEEGYSLSAKIQVYMGEQETEFEYDTATGKIILKEVTDDVVIYANGISKASLPMAELMDMNEMLWCWTAEEGVQAYEYAFWQEDMEIERGRISVEEGQVAWNWSERLENGDYQLCLKAIGDNIHCMNSEENNYLVTVEKELLQPSKSPEENDNKPLQSPENVEGDETPRPSEDIKTDVIPQPSENPESPLAPESVDENELLPSSGDVTENDGLLPTPEKLENELLPSDEGIMEEEMH